MKRGVANRFMSVIIAKISIQLVTPEERELGCYLIQWSVSFMYDVTTANFSLDVHIHLYVAYLGSWMGHGEAVAWSLVLPYLKPLDISLWVQLKSIGYETPVDIPMNLIRWTVVASADINVTLGMLKRVRKSFLRRCILWSGVRDEILERHF